MWSKNCRASVQQLCERGTISFEIIQRVGIENCRAIPRKQNALDEFTSFLRFAKTGADGDRITAGDNLFEIGSMFGPPSAERFGNCCVNRSTAVGITKNPKEPHSRAQRTLTGKDRSSRHSLSAGDDRDALSCSLVRIVGNRRNARVHPCAVDEERKLARLLLAQPDVDKSDIAAHFARQQRTSLQDAESNRRRRFD